MKVGDRVERKITGEGGVGVVYALVNPFDYLKTQTNLHYRLGRWSELYPDWLTKPVAFVCFDVPRKTYTLVELRASLARDKINVTEEQVQKLYDNAVTTFLVAYPIDDLNIVN